MYASVASGEGRGVWNAIRHGLHHATIAVISNFTAIRRGLRARPHNGHTTSSVRGKRSPPIMSTYVSIDAWVGIVQPVFSDYRTVSSHPTFPVSKPNLTPNPPKIQRNDHRPLRYHGG